MEEQDIFETLGVEPAAQEQTLEQEDAGLTQDATATQEQGQEVAEAEAAQGEQAHEPGWEEPDQEEDHPEREEPEGEDHQEQTREQRAVHAQRRRDRERRQQEAVQRAVEQALAQREEQIAGQLKDAFAGVGLKNTVTGQPIETLDELIAWQETAQGQRLERELAEGKLSQEGLAAAIGSHPVVRRAQEVIRQQEQAAAQAKEREAQARADEELAKIRLMNPDIQGLGDILAMDTGKAFYGYVKRGNSFEDAYYLANREQIEQDKAKAARQKAMNDARGKDHLQGTGNARGAGMVSVPADEMSLFRELMPGVSEVDIQEYYNRQKRR